MSKEFDEELCCNVEIKQEVVDDPLDVVEEARYHSFNEYSHENTLNTAEKFSIKVEPEENDCESVVIKEETFVNFSENNHENELNMFEFQDNFKVEIEEFEKARSVGEDYPTNSDKKTSELNIMNPGTLLFYVSRIFEFLC